MKTLPTLYKRDTRGAVRVWFMQQDGPRHRTVHGLKDGDLVESGWTDCVGKQGRSDEEQAAFEVASGYEHQLTREYHESEDTIDQPRFFKPMLAQKYEEFPGFCYAQPKLDGIRCIVTKAGMFSRQGKPILGAPHIRRDLEGFFNAHPGAVLDGELYNHDLKDDFNTIVSAVKKQKPSAEDLAKSEQLVQYHAYDMPSAEGSFGERFGALSRGMTLAGMPVALVDTRRIPLQDELDEAYAEWLEQGYEGQMVRLDGLYEQKRSKLLLKRKEFQDEDYEVVRIEPGVGNWAGAAKKVVCRLPDGREFGAGIKGTYARGVELLNEQHNLATIKFFALTPDGIPRFGVATKFHGVGGRL